MADDELDLKTLADDELVPQMHDDLYDGLKEEIEEGVRILLDRGWAPYKVLTEALVEGMRIVGIVSARIDPARVNKVRGMIPVAEHKVKISRLGVSPGPNAK